MSYALGASAGLFTMLVATSWHHTPGTAIAAYLISATAAVAVGAVIAHCATTVADDDLFAVPGGGKSHFGRPGAGGDALDDAR